MTAPTILLEAYLGGAWQDLTGSLLASHGRGIRISRGRANEAASAQPGRCEFALESRTGEWTEGSPASHPDWAAGARVRVTVNGTVRFAGTISSPVTRWPDREDALHAITTVTATDVIADLAAAPLEDSVASLLVRGLAPSALWPLDDPAGSTQARSLVPGVPPLEFGTNLDGHPLDPQTLYHFGVSAPEGGPRTGSWLGLTPAVDGPPLWHAWATPRGTRQLPSSAVPVTVLGWHTRTTAPLEVTTLLMRLGPIAVYQLTDGYLQLEYASTATLAGATPLDTPVLLALVVTATTATLHSSAGGSVSVAVDPGAIDYPWFEVGASPSYGDPGSTGLWSNIATVPAVLSLADVRSLAGRAAASLGAPVSSWLGAATGETVQVLGYDHPMLAPATHGVSPAGIGDSLADVAGAMWVADRASDQPTWIDPRWVGPVTALPGEAVDLDRLEWAADRSLRVTDVTSEGRLLASSGLTPRVTRDLAPLLRPLDLQGRADWLASTGAVMGAPRLGGTAIDLLTWPWEGTQVNLCANPSFEQTSGTVIARRNLATRPNPINTAGWLTNDPARFAPSYDASGGRRAGTGARKFVRQGSNDSVIASAYAVGMKDWTQTDRASITAGQTYTVTVYGKANVAHRGVVTVGTYDAAGVNVGSFTGSFYPNTAANQWGRAQVTFVAPAGATKCGIGNFQISTVSGDTSGGEQAWMCDALYERTSVALTYLGGTYSPDSDYVSSWAGTADDSQTVATVNLAVNATNAGSSDWFVFSSQQWARTGTRSLRIANISNMDGQGYAVVAGTSASLTGLGVTFVPGKTYTVLAYLNMVDAQFSPFSLARRIRVLGNLGAGNVEIALSDQPPNAPGTHEVRLTFTLPAGATSCHVRAYHGAPAGNASVRWDDLMIVEGAYTGPWTPDTYPGVSDFLALDLRHRVRIPDPPPQVPSVLRTATVEGYEETIALDQWGLNLNLAPDPRGIWGDPVQGVLGAAAGNRYGT